MDAKLTLKLDKEVIERAKRFAREYNTSISKIVERYLDRITRPEKEQELPELTPMVRSLYGIASLLPDFDPETAYVDYLIRKHSPGDAD